ncbi:MAG: hypothetical protein WDN69_09040 [Aliidongia sp.]
MSDSSAAASAPVALGLDEAGGDILLAGLGQQLLDHRLRLLVFAFAEMVVADASLRIDEVMRRPELVLERAPDV